MFWEAHHYVCETSEIETKLVSEAVRAVEKFGVTAVVFESLPEMDAKAGQFATAVKNRLRDLAIPTFDITEQQLFDSFAFPSIQSRQELRQIVVTLFPQLQSSRLAQHCLDAAADGLYFETNRLLAVKTE
jgi:hypothetical protein